MDRNKRGTILEQFTIQVALHPEGVDRNALQMIGTLATGMSPSTRRAWIEIEGVYQSAAGHPVALHPEGVDRNCFPPKPLRKRQRVALHPEGVDRNLP